MITNPGMGNKYILMNNLLLIHKMSSDVKPLIGALSTKELQILRNNPDLVERIRVISTMGREKLEEELSDVFELEIHDGQVGACWIGTTNLSKYTPSWDKSSPPGWYLELEAEENEESDFEIWAKDLLVQEVRINLWMRYIELKKSEKTKPLLPGFYL